MTMKRADVRENTLYKIQFLHYVHNLQFVSVIQEYFFSSFDAHKKASLPFRKFHSHVLQHKTVINHDINS